MQSKVKWLIFALLMCGTAYGQNWSGIIDPTRAVNWSAGNMGVPGGIPSGSWTQCTNLACASANAAGTGATAAQVNAALAQAATNGNQYVLLATGTYNFSAGLKFVGNTAVLRGAGPKLTILNFTGTVSCGGVSSLVCMVNSVAIYDASASATPPCGGGGAAYCGTWASGYSQGTTSISLSGLGNGSGGIHNGDLVLLDQLNDIVDGGGVVQGDLPTGTLSGNDGAFGRCQTTHDCGATNTHYSQVQVSRVTAGCSSPCTGAGPFTVTISPGVYPNNIRVGQSPGVWWSGTPISQVGIESLQIVNNSTPQTITTMYDCYQCWIKNVAQHGTNQRNQVYAVQSFQGEVRDSYFFGSKGTTGSYGFEASEISNFKVENNIFDQQGSPIILDNIVGNIFDYNLAWNDQASPSTFLQTDLPSHDAGNWGNLFEGNVTGAYDSDNQHGNSPGATIFRNWVPGNQPVPNDKTHNTQSFGVDALARTWNVLGNVLGSRTAVGGTYNGRPCNINADAIGGGTCTGASYQDTYQTNSGGSNVKCYTSIYALGWGAVSAGCTTPGGTSSVSSPDATVASTMYRFGNYDTITAATRWCGNSGDTGWVAVCGSTSEVPTTGGNFFGGQAVPASETFPASFIYSSQPPWFQSSYATIPWPPIGPDVTGGQGPAGHAYMTPAYQCLANGTFTSGILNFDAPTCFTASGGSPAVTLTPSSRNFGNIVSGFTSVGQTVTLQNTGTATLTISSIALTGGTQFHITSNTCGGMLAATATCIVTVQFAPTSTGTKNDTLRFTTNASSSPDNASMTGVGIGAAPNPTSTVLYMFSGAASPGGNFTTFWNQGVATGVVLVFGWGQVDVDGNPAHYTWTAVDAEINSYISTYPGIKIAVLMAPAKDVSPNNTTFTPNYISTNANVDMCACGSYAGSGATATGCYKGNVSNDTTIVPSPFNATFAANWNTFMSNAVAHFLGASYFSSLGYLVTGTQKGGENFPACSTQQQALVSPSNVTQLKTVWTAMNDTLGNTIRTADNSRLLTEMMGIGCVGNSSPTTANNCDLADSEAAVLNKYGIGLRVTNLAASDATNYAGGAPAGGDWVVNFANYNLPKDLQQGQESSPTGACASTAGTLTQLLPFAGQHWGPSNFRVHEILTNDGYGTYVTGYTDSCYPTQCITGTCPYGPNDKAIRGLLNGLAPAANIINGNTIINGNVIIPGPISQNTVPLSIGGPPGYAFSTTSLADAGTITPIFTSTTPGGPTSASGDIQNTVRYDTTLNPSGVNAITRITDGRTVSPSGQSIGNLTCSGGDNNKVISTLGNYFAPVGSGGTGRVYNLTINASNQIQVLNSGSIPAVSVVCPFWWSSVPATETTIYYLAAPAKIMVETIKSDASAILTGPTQLFDFATCPGAPSPVVDTGDFFVSNDDKIFTTTLSDLTGQGWATTLAAYNANTGTCATTNMLTGAVIDYTGASLGTLSTSGNSCWGIPNFTGTVNTVGTAVTLASGSNFTWDVSQKEIYINGVKYSTTGTVNPTSLTLSGVGAGTQSGVAYVVRNGIHGNQASLDGTYWTASFGANGPWLQGACAANSNNNQDVYVQIASLNTAWTFGNSPSNHGSHSSVGFQNSVSPFNAGPNIRANNNVTSSTIFAAAIPYTDAHGAWPHPGNVDTYPWIMASDNGTSGNGIPYAPKYIQAEVFAYFPLIAYPPGGSIKRFFHTFNCGGASAPCSGGAETSFGALNSIGVVDPLGRYFCWASSMLQNLGTDNNSQLRRDAFCGMLQ